MFKWLNKRISDYFDKRRSEVDAEIEERLAEIEKHFKKQLKESKEKLDSHCNLYLEMSKESHRKKREELDQFIETASERLKNSFTEECEGQDLKKMLHDCFTEYASGIDFSLRPRLTEDESDVKSYKWELVKTASFSKEERFSGGQGDNKGEFINQSTRNLYLKVIDEALDVGAKLGSDVMFAEIHTSEATDYDTYSYGGKRISIQLLVNVDYYKFNGDPRTEEEDPDIDFENPMIDLGIDLDDMDL